MLKIRVMLLPSILFCLAIGNSFQISFAQQSLVSQITPGQRDAVAVDVIEKSLAALGGKNSIAAVQSVETTGVILNTGSQTPLSFHWKVAVLGSHFEFRQETNDGMKTRIFTSGHGKPAVGVLGNKGRLMSEHMAIADAPFDLPAILLYIELQDPAYSITSADPSAGDNLLHVRVTNNKNIVMKAVVQQDWYFSPVTGLPVRVEYNLPEMRNALDSIRASCVYLSYAVQQGVQYPSSIQALESGIEVSTVTISTTNPNFSFNESDFDMPLQDTSSGGSR